MKFTIVSKALIAKSAITMKALKELAKYDPEALKLRDEKGNEYFVFTTGSPSIGKFGISFDGVSLDSDEFATATIHVDAVGVEDTCKVVNDIIAPAMKNIIALEDQIATALITLEECRERAESATEVIA